MWLLLLAQVLLVQVSRAEVPAVTDGLWYGMSVAGLGDIDGDGYDDVLVGAPAQTDARAYVYMGGPGELANPPDQELSSPGGEGDFSVEVSAAGDVDGDGLQDAAVGERSCAGSVFVYPGGRGGLDVERVWTIFGPACDATIGDEVAAIGDVDGDGWDDLAIGSQESDENTGEVLLFYGSAEGVGSEQDRTLHGQSPAGSFGGALAGAGDVNGDGYPDLLVGARNANDSGEVHLFLGGAEGPGGESDARFATDESGASFGVAVAGLGDVDGDGLSDLAVGASSGADDLGSVSWYPGDEGGVPELALTLTGPAAFSNYGASLAGPGDVNGDGYADLAVGVYALQRGLGGVQRLLGGPDGLSELRSRSLEGAEGSRDWFGFALDAGGDINGDGWMDTLVSALGETAGAGSLTVLWGERDADADGWPASEDCDDDDVLSHPEGTEIAGDGQDQDCDGQDLPGSGAVDDSGDTADAVNPVYTKSDGCACANAGRRPAETLALLAFLAALSRRRPELRA